MSKITFKSIAIQNLGPFANRQMIDLTVRAARPIILVKALNGSGKTTLLTCLQVVLYGSKALGNGRATEYDQLIRGLHRHDAKGSARIELELIIDANGERDIITVAREWKLSGSRLSERLSVSQCGTEDLTLSEDWDEFIDGILPSELVQLFLFDGERIESLANPKTLPDMLRRATEAFLGIGGIDSLSKDLFAVERRTVLRVREESGEYAKAQANLIAIESQHNQVCTGISVLNQTHSGQQIKVDSAKKSLANFSAKAKRSGLDAYEQVAELRASESHAAKVVAEAEGAVREALADPLAPLAGLQDLWKLYADRWHEERETKIAKNLLTEISKRDRRIVSSLRPTTSKELLITLVDAFKTDNVAYEKVAKRETVLLDADSPDSMEPRILQATRTYQTALSQLAIARIEHANCQRKLAAIPQGDRLAELLVQMQAHAAELASAEERYEASKRELGELQGKKNHLEMKLNAAQQRLSKDFRGLAHHEKAIAAGQRARAVLEIYKDRLLASKATWLSEMITSEFRGLMRKQRLISKVVVDPETYAVSIVGAGGHELPMERLSAGERQLLAVSVLSALIRERKGRFPVVVDTPLARLDRTHREALIRRFFAKVSHQVLVLSTDEEVEGSVFHEMAKHTSAAYQIEFSDELHSSTVGPLINETEKEFA
jgi:DNA sulfur modification protein DndD